MDSECASISILFYLFVVLFLAPFLRGRPMWFSIHERNFEPNIVSENLIVVRVLIFLYLLLQ